MNESETAKKRQGRTNRREGEKTSSYRYNSRARRGNWKITGKMGDKEKKEEETSIVSSNGREKDEKRQEEASLEELSKVLKEALAGEEKLRNEAHEKRRNLFCRKGKKWEGKEKFESWIQTKAEEWKVDGRSTIRAVGEAKVVTFTEESTRNKFWSKRKEIIAEGQFEVDEDLGLEERVRRNKLVELGNKLRSRGNYCRIENRYMVVENEKERTYYKWHPSTGLYEVEEPNEEREEREKVRLERKAKEEEERRKKQDW